MRIQPIDESISVDLFTLMDLYTSVDLSSAVDLYASVDLHTSVDLYALRSAQKAIKMKKFYICIISVVVISLSIGLAAKSSYTSIDTSEISEDLNQYIVTSFLDSTTFENTFSYDDSGNESINPPLIDKALSKLRSSEYVVLGESTGRTVTLFGTIQQEVKIIKIYKGNADKLDNIIKLTSPGVYFKSDWEVFSGSVINTMKKDQKYLIFFNADNRLDNLYIMSNLSMSYFNIEDQENYIPNEIDQKETEEQTINKAFVNGIIYYKVKNNEFFVKDQTALEKINKIKSDILDEYMKE